MLDQTMRAFTRARARRADWERAWRDSYDHTIPERAQGLGASRSPAARNDRLFDGTAADAVEQLAASLLAELMPPWSRWFGLRPGHDVPPERRGAMAEALDAVTERVHGHLDRSGFAIEMHQCLLDLAIIGTATLRFTEAPPGAASAFEFQAVPAAEIFLEGCGAGRIRQQFRRTTMTLAALRGAFPGAALPAQLVEEAEGRSERSFEVIESVAATGDGAGAGYVALLPACAGVERPIRLADGRFDRSPLITFRWLKAAGEIYGRSPVMTALPDIKTANEVVQLILKNASIAVAGIWLADDDGSINLANIKLVPGAIIPRSAGSAGLVPLAAPGRFDVSQLVLDDLRARIRRTLLVDRLGPSTDTRMTATEVLERSTETARILGAVFGRLQAELMLPLVERALVILHRRGEIDQVVVDGREVELDYRSPLARAQARDDVRNTLLWLQTVAGLGPAAAEVADTGAAARWLARTLGVPSELVRNDRGDGGGIAELLASITASPR